jgi:hypothetical protein
MASADIKMTSVDELQFDEKLENELRRARSINIPTGPRLGVNSNLRRARSPFQTFHQISVAHRQPLLYPDRYVGPGPTNELTDQLDGFGICASSKKKKMDEGDVRTGGPRHHGGGGRKRRYRGTR